MLKVWEPLTPWAHHPAHAQEHPAHGSTCGGRCGAGLNPRKEYEWKARGMEGGGHIQQGFLVPWPAVPPAVGRLDVRYDPVRNVCPAPRTRYSPVWLGGVNPSP